jgi:hypothetical protein
MGGGDKMEKDTYNYYITKLVSVAASWTKRVGFFLAIQRAAQPVTPLKIIGAHKIAQNLHRNAKHTRKV